MGSALGPSSSRFKNHGTYSSECCYPYSLFRNDEIFLVLVEDGFLLIEKTQIFLLFLLKTFFKKNFSNKS